MDEKKKKTWAVLTLITLISYILYGILWMHSAIAYIDMDGTISAELTDKITKEGTMRNICEICTYVFFLICSWYTWDGEADGKYVSYFANMSKVIISVLALGLVFTGIHFLIVGTVWNNYLLPVVMLILILFANLFLTSGMQAKKDIKRE